MYKGKPSFYNELKACFHAHSDVQAFEESEKPSCFLLVHEPEDMPSGEQWGYEYTRTAPGGVDFSIRRLKQDKRRVIAALDLSIPFMLNNVPKDTTPITLRSSPLICAPQ